MAKVSIGMPVYNGEKKLKKALDSLLNQTFKDFELIISDNASNDLTESICREYLSKDRRIKYIRQKINQGAVYNFYFVLSNAQSEYFMWAAHDDFWYPTFIEKNLNLLFSDSTCVLSISKVNIINNDFIDSYSLGTYPISGKYIHRIRKYLNNPGYNSRFYGIIRTKNIVESFTSKDFLAADWFIMTRLLKHGNFGEVNEVLMERSSDGASKSLINLYKIYNITGVHKIFPLWNFNKYLIYDLGKIYIFSVFDKILKLNYSFIKGYLFTFSFIRKVHGFKKIVINKLIN